MAHYESKIIRRYAAYLHGKAQSLILLDTVTGVMTGWGLGKAYETYESLVASFKAMTASPSNAILDAFGIAQSHAQPSASPMMGWTWIGALIAGLIGFWIGWNKAFVLKLQSQMALCQVKIEESLSQILSKG